MFLTVVVMRNIITIIYNTGAHWVLLLYCTSDAICVLCTLCSMARENQWGFDRTVTKKYGCKDMAYDPT